MKRLLVVILIMLLSFSRPVPALDDSIRVLIKENINSANILIKGNYKIQLPFTEEELSRGRNLRSELTLDGSRGIKVAEDNYNVFAVEFLAGRDGAIYLDSRPYRGKLRFIKDRDSLIVVNIIPLEDYLNGVLEYEVAHWWPIEALKAQAVAARTYALYMKDMNKNKSYDLRSDVFSQVYGGKLGERRRIKRAVFSTRGFILMHQDKILPAFYHSTCGGHTDDVSHIWNMESSALGGVSCEFCLHSKHYRWDRKIRVEEFKDNFKRSGYDFNNIEKVLVKERYDSGYVKSVEIFADGKLSIISAKEFRSILGANIVRSRRFILDKIGNAIDIRGYGWGHGIGLCQWGAYGMSKKGYKFAQILEHYYPGSKIKKIVWDGK